MNRNGTPLRYPGGKQKLAPFFKELIDQNELEGCDYAEAYAGGAGVAIDLLLSGKVNHIHLNDSCPALYAFWRSILTKPDEFCRMIRKVSLTVDEWKSHREVVRHPSRAKQLDLGFAMFYLNRCNRSGIQSGGLIGGLKQTGKWKMNARFPILELVRRVEAIAAKRKQITAKNMDAEVFLKQHVKTLPRETLVYCDPPYFHKADRLYANYYLSADHKRIATLIQKHVKCHWVVSYDSVPEIADHYEARRSLEYELQYNVASAYKGKEIMFFSDGIELPETCSFKPISAAIPGIRRHRKLPKLVRQSTT